MTEILARLLTNMVSFSVDGNFHLSRNAKGGGPVKDPSLFRDWGYWVGPREICNDYLSFFEGKKDPTVRAFDLEPRRDS